MTKARPQKDARPRKGAPPATKKAARPAKKAARPAQKAARPAPKAARPAPKTARPPTEARAPREARPPQEPREARPREPRELPSGPPRSGRVALLGRPNVGKSTLLNAALGQPLAIVSPTPQTTRDAILGVAHHGTAEFALLDTPGLHRPLTELGRAMNEAAREAARSADVVVFMAEMRPQQGPRPRIPAPHPGDVALLADLGTDAPVVLVINKIDRVSDKRLLLPLMTAFAKLRDFAAMVPVSALSQDGVDRVLDEVAKLLPEGPWRYAPDELTDRPARFFVAEYVREQILRATQAEVPHASAVQIDRFLEPLAGVVQIDATIHVERPGQKKILIGAGASMLKRIGTQARQRIEELVGRQVNLKLWVRVSPEWRQSARDLQELGYRTPAGEKGSVVLAELPDDDAGEDGEELIEDTDADADADAEADADADADADAEDEQ